MIITIGSKKFHKIQCHQCKHIYHKNFQQNKTKVYFEKNKVTEKQNKTN